MTKTVQTEPTEDNASEAARLVAERMSERDQRWLVAAARAEDILGLEPGSLMTPTIATLGIDGSTTAAMAARTILQGYDDQPDPTDGQVAALGDLLTWMEAGS